MKSLRLMILLAACCSTGTSWAAEPTPAKPASPAAAAPAAQGAAKPGAESAVPNGDEDSKDKEGAKDGEAATAKPKASAADKGASPQRFVPTEQVRADFDVSFPIDI